MLNPFLMWLYRLSQSANVHNKGLCGFILSCSHPSYVMTSFSHSLEQSPLLYGNVVSLVCVRNHLNTLCVQ